MDKLGGMSMDIVATNLEKVKSLFPECVSEGKLDIDKLLSLCGEYIDNDFEKYKFEWKGKAECLRLAQKRSTGTLRPCESESVGKDGTSGKFDSDNLYIEGDNLEVLKLLQTAYYRRVKMIYIDPPYNTGNDFVYEDDFADPINRYKEVTSQTTKSNPETMGRYHTNWLNMMYPRLRLAANLLRDDGVIFISIDDNEQANLKKVCDEVFGEENFVGQLILQTATDNNPRQISTEHEYILCYAKDLEIQDFWSANSEKAALIEDKYEELKHRFDEDINKIQDELRIWIKQNKEKLKGVTHYDNVDKNGVFHDGDIANTKFGGYIYDVIHPKTKKVCKVPEKGFRYPKESMMSMIASGDIMFGEDENTLIKPKKRLLNAKDILRTVIYEDGRASTKIVDNFLGRSVFQNPKSNKIIARLINFTSQKESNDIILDFFSGSATTAHAVMQLNAEDGGNRKFIMVQLPELCDEKSEAYKAGYKNICEIGKERIRRAGAKIRAEQEEKLKSRSCKLDEERAEVVSARTLRTQTNEAASVTKYNAANPTFDTGFKVFKLDASNLVMWDSAPIENHDIETLYSRLNAMTNSVKPDRTDMDVVAEIMLKMGVPLDIPVTKIDVNGKAAYAVGDYLLLICLAENVTAEDMEKLCDLAPGKLVIAESSFADTSAMRNANYIVRDRSVSLKLV